MINMLLAASLDLYTFTYSAPTNTKAVSIAGTFNGWNKDANPMRRTGDGSTFTISLKLEPGRHQYKFVVDGEKWVTDPRAVSVDDGNGNVNSVFVAQPKDYVAPARRGDGQVTESALKHLAEIPDRNWDRGKLQISIRVRPNDIESVRLLTSKGTISNVAEIQSDDLYARMVASIDWDGKTPFRYTFELTDGKLKKFFGPKGLTSLREGNEFFIDSKSFKPFEVPSWVERSVLYQVFPDRFENGNPNNDPKGVVAWSAKPTYSNWFGGDVVGVQKHLGYLKDLGVNGVYFTPVFEGPSNHRYETTDYRLVDHRFGTNAEFQALTKEMHKLGMKTILDTVFNHTSTDFFAFKDIRQNGEKSKYLDWFWIKSFPVKVGANPNYVAWFNYPSLPKLNVDSPAATKYLLDSVSYWRREFGVDGLRLDVGNEVSQAFWKKLRTRVKSESPDTWIVGEVWGDGSQWLRGDQWDSVMNYPFLFSTLKFVGPKGDGRPSTLWSDLMSNYSRYAPQVSRNLMNLLGSHDTARILTQCGGKSELHRLAAVLQFTWVGAPCVYYGDELGMAGGPDPDNRKGMEWALATTSNPTLALYRKLTSLRKSSPILQSGTPELISADDKKQILVFSRRLNGRRVIIALNRSSNPQTTSFSSERSESAFVEALAGKNIHPTGKTISITLAPFGAAILTPSFKSASSRSHRPYSGAMSNTFVMELK